MTVPKQVWRTVGMFVPTTDQKRVWRTVGMFVPTTDQRRVSPAAGKIVRANNPKLLVPLSLQMYVHHVIDLEQYLSTLLMI
jgi:hypothetical protein